ncbi:MAG: antibiotic biosynthesis monooxygenase [Acidimicrobiaceae bacterium]|nr:antibiotic biosynthesis monooxygenase [Acidimicrobiaceae bacterium]
MITVIARWVADEGKDGELESLLGQLAVASRSEKGCIAYQPLRHKEEKNVFAICEQYVDEDAFEDHKNSSHFQELVIARALPLLAERQVDVFSNI